MHKCSPDVDNVLLNSQCPLPTPHSPLPTPHSQKKEGRAVILLANPVCRSLKRGEHLRPI
ncbi:hypothetical protein PI95_030885 [Hassallia byssoidea VB512170]|uniref:Uncharacterized protein n=1 Tax=Hassallia byssoidea VB512170 TaxID=1304833 RepID=A0A846HIN4_9CYAN|nr:hypothetical protein [Hassalia byssoidea]NEU76798.1 hypothetical protein [Hassalia byssoidea VB512170]